MNIFSFVFSVFILEYCFADVRSGKAFTIKLNDGNDIPVLGLGTSARGGDPKEIQKAVEIAIAEGYRHIDTAYYYKIEKEVGLGLNNKIQDGTVNRSDLFITTKLWSDKHAKHQVVPALRESLDNLGLDYVDLYLIHWPVSVFENGTFSNEDYVQTWRGMEEAQILGLTKSIGVSNFNETQLERILANSKVKPAVNQIEVNPNMIQKKLVGFCQDKGIQVVAYSPLGSMAERLSKNNRNAPAPSLDDPILTEIGNKYNKNTVQVVLRYLVDRGLITIPKSVKPHRIRQNIDIFDFKLTLQDIIRIDEFNLDHRVVPFLAWKDSPYYPF